MSKKSNIYSKCPECKKELPIINHAGIISLKLSYPRFDNLGRLAETKFQRIEIETESLCKDCIEKITGNLKERLELSKSNQLIKIIKELFKLSHIKGKFGE